MFQIQIPNPCHEDWDKMTPTQKGAFCKVCAKEVFDFTQSSNHEIKETLSQERTPCVRILQSQMDEMNFFEWFRSLILRKKLNYLFLFSLIIANQNITAQEIKIDSADILNIDSSIISKSDDELDALINPSCEIAGTESWMGSIYVPIEWELPIGGIPAQPVGGTIISTETIMISGMIGPRIDPEAAYEIQFENEIVILDEVYSFSTENDSLIFRSLRAAKGQIFLSIEQDRISKKPYPPYDEVFESPILLEAGEQLMKIPIGQYANGSYTIKIKSKKGEGIARIMYR